MHLEAIITTAATEGIQPCCEAIRASTAAMVKCFKLNYTFLMKNVKLCFAVCRMTMLLGAV